MIKVADELDAGPKKDAKSAELNIRLELEHDRFYKTSKQLNLNPKKIPPEPKKKEFHFHKLAFFLPRRVRAQEAIGEIEKERILLKQKLDIRNSDYEQKAQVRFEF